MTMYEIKEKLKEQAEVYSRWSENPTEEDFISWIGYDPRWMADFTDQPDGEPMTEAECKEIDRIIKSAWNEFLNERGGE